MKIELVDELESVTFEVTDKNAKDFIQSRLDAGRDFEVLFPDYKPSD